MTEYVNQNNDEPQPGADYPGRGELNGIVHRLRLPQVNGTHLHPALVMIHGYQGNENVTWIFAKAIGPEWLVGSPRAPLAVPNAQNGFSWYRFDANGKSDLETYQQSIQYLERYIEGLQAKYPIDPKRLIVLGFSQGAAMAYGYGLTHPVGGVVSMGGFIPGTMPRPLPRVETLPILILHGTLDGTISVEIARKNSLQLLEAGAQVTYQEEEVGHRVGIQGMRLLERWLAERAQG